MLTRDDLNDALDSWFVEERERLGGKPPAETIVAFLRGQLPAEESARVQTLLAYYPELTPLLKERSDKERAARKRTTLKMYVGATTLMAAILASDTLQQRRKSGQPVVPSSHHEFNPLLARGPATIYELTAGQQRYLITIVPSEPPAATAYNLEIARDARVLWRAQHVRPVNDVFIIDIPGAFLTPGTYTLSIRADGKIVDRYSFRVTQ